MKAEFLDREYVAAQKDKYFVQMQICSMLHQLFAKLEQEILKEKQLSNDLNKSKSHLTELQYEIRDLLAKLDS